MAGIKSVVHTDGNVVERHFFGSLGMDGFHGHVGQLVGNVETGVTDGAHFVHADHLGVAGAQMEFLVDDAFTGLSGHSQLAEGDLTVTTVEFGHDAFGAFGITGHDGHAGVQIQILHVTDDVFFHREEFLITPAGKIDENGVDTVFLQNQCRVEGTVGFTHGAQQFTGGRQIGAAVEVAEAAQFHQMLQAVVDAFHAFVDKVVGGFHIQTETFKSMVDLDHFKPGVFQLFLPGIIVPCGETAVDAGFSGLFVFQQQVCDAAVGGNHKDTVVKFRTFALADDDIFDDLPEAAHAGAADLFHGVITHSPDFSNVFQEKIERYIKIRILQYEAS